MPLKKSIVLKIENYALTYVKVQNNCYNAAINTHIKDILLFTTCVLNEIKCNKVNFIIPFSCYDDDDDDDDGYQFNLLYTCITITFMSFLLFSFFVDTIAIY